MSAIVIAIVIAVIAAVASVAAAVGAAVAAGLFAMATRGLEARLQRIDADLEKVVRPGRLDPALATCLGPRPGALRSLAEPLR